MHVLGKVLLFFVIVAAVAAAVMTSWSLDLRAHYLRQVTEARVAYAKMEGELLSNRTRHREAQEALDRTKQAWGNTWQAANSRPVNPATGSVSIGVGQQLGLGAAAGSRTPNPYIHIFYVEGDRSDYLGQFKIQSAQAGATDAVLSRPPYPGQNFPAGTWRIRELIPFSYSGRFLDLHATRIADEARLGRMQYDVQRLQEQLAASQHLLQERINQLDGEPDGNPDVPNPTELQKAGFVKAIRDGIDERDRLIARYHALQVERRLKFETLLLIQKENEARLTAFEQQVGTYFPEQAPVSATN